MPTQRTLKRQPSEAEKRAIIVACDEFIRDVLKPRFLPEITPTKFNYSIDIYGKWHGGRYRFIQRYRSDGHPAKKGKFESAFARFDYIGMDRFDVMWHRHTGQWFRLYSGVPLVEALRHMRNDGLLHPV